VQVDSVGMDADQKNAAAKVAAAKAAAEKYATEKAVGKPFAVLALSLDDFRGAHPKPTALLTRKATAMLFPVESNGRVVDAFLMVFRDGHWVRHGYANTGVTRLLVKARDAYAKEHDLSVRSFYVVSIPGRAAFFAAYGRGKDAVLIPASSDPSINAVEGRPVPAAQELETVAVAIHRDDKGAVRKLPKL
jgi:hypothetical protein